MAGDDRAITSVLHDDQFAIGRSLGVTTVPAFVQKGQSKPWLSMSRMLAFISLHGLCFGVQVAVICDFGFRDFKFHSGPGFCFFLALLPFTFSGTICALVSWHCKLHTTNCTFLPLKGKPFLLAFPLAIYYGWCQGIILALSFEEYRLHQCELSSSALDTRDSSIWPTAYKINCKAVNGIFEGLMLSAILLYSAWGVEYPSKAEAWTPIYWRGESEMLHACGLIAFFAAGFGLFELDFCISSRVARRMDRNTLYEGVHFLFRTVEVMVRLSMFIAFIVTVRTVVWWWWVPTVVDVVMTLGLVAVFGGAEANSAVWLLCGLPCSFANIFQFVDSPYKQQAAQKLSRCLTCRTFLEIVIFSSLAILVRGRDVLDVWWELRMYHPIKAWTALTSLPLYWVLLCYLCCPRWQRDMQKDLYSACSSGDVSAVVKLADKAGLHFDINFCNVYGQTPLILAVIGSHHEICRVLLRNNARVDEQEFSDISWELRGCHKARRRWTALHYAAWIGDPEILRILLRSDHNTATLQQAPALEPMVTIDEVARYRDRDGNTPLHIAVARDRVDAAGILATAKPEWLTIKNAQLHTPVLMARTPFIRTVLEGQLGLERTSPLLLADRQTLATERPWVQLKIHRTNNDHKLSAPGLCSFVAASSGGMLGKLRQPRNPQNTPRIIPGVPLAVDVPGGSASASAVHASRCGAHLLTEVPPELDDNPSPMSTSPRVKDVILLHDLPIEESSERSVPRVSDTVEVFGDREEDSKRSDPFFEHGELCALPSPTTSVRFVEEARNAEQAETNPSSEAERAHPLPREVNLQELEPSDMSGNAILWWNEMAARARQSQSEPGTTKDGTLYLSIPDESLLGSGSYGQVWRGKSITSGDCYAIKNIQVPRRGTDAVALREAEMVDHLRLLPHPCIVQLFGVHHFPDVRLYAFVMELCTGGDLKAVIKTARQSADVAGLTYKPPENSLRWIGEIFLGLEHLHSVMGTLLRDLKPDNVVLTDSSCGIAKLTDFGMGRSGVESEGAWTFGLPPGTPGYIAPEVIRAQKYNFSADLYCLGVLIWVLLTGGLIDQVEPAPPCSKMAYMFDYGALYEDWAALKRCVESPAEHRALPLRADAQDLVLQLTQREPSARPAHHQIRQTCFFEALNLPAPDASINALRAWLFA